jgi:hypothetical protein
VGGRRLGAAVWRVPPERLKRKLEHEVPLSSSTARRENPASAATYLKDAELEHFLVRLNRRGIPESGWF